MGATVRTFTFSEIDTWMRCEQKHSYAYERKLEPIATARALSRGTMVHECVEAFWRGKDFDDIAIHIDHWDTEDEEERSLVRWLMERYCKRYTADRAATTLVVSEFPWRIELDGFALAGWIDRLIVREGKLWLVETKTMGQWDRINNLSMDPQLSIYYWALRELGFDVWGAEYDAIYTYRWKREERPVESSFAIVRLDRDETQIAKFVEDAREVCKRIAKASRRSGPRKYDRVKHIVQFGPMACSNCPFRDPCQESLRGYLEEEELLLTEMFKRKGEVR
jgi:hypothetical protein